MSLLSEFFLSSAPTVAQLDLLEITHPNFSTTYRIVRNARRRISGGRFGVSVTHEGGAGPFEYEYYPARVTPIGSGSDMGQVLAVTLGDLGDIIQKEIAVVTLANKMNIKPTLKYRTYRSDDLTQPMFGPLTLEIKEVTCAEEGNTFNAHAPLLNNTRTGTLYSFDQFPMLRGFF